MANGEIRNQNGFRQKVTFKTLGLAGGIFPTDIDGVFEIKNKLWIFFEVKHKLAPITRGQKLFLERTVDVIDGVEGKHACGFIVEHEIDSKRDIEAGECPVRMYRHEGKWHKPSSPLTLASAVQKLYGKHFNES